MPCGCKCGKKSMKYWGELQTFQSRYPHFSNNDLHNMIEWFHNNSIDGRMSQGDFAEAMGFTSHAAYIFDRMFKVMDKDDNGYVSCF